MEKIIFEDLPSTKTPLNAENLNKIQENVENNINEINNKFKYSTEEQIIGTWFGKPLYGKTFRLTNIGTEQSLGLENVDDIFFDTSHSYITWDKDNLRYPIDRAKFQYWKERSLILAQHEGVKEWQAVITLNYTKTTD
jgi:hypothetical protein